MALIANRLISDFPEPVAPLLVSAHQCERCYHVPQNDDLILPGPLHVIIRIVGRSEYVWPTRPNRFGFAIAECRVVH